MDRGDIFVLRDLPQDDDKVLSFIEEAFSLIRAQNFEIPGKFKAVSRYVGSPAGLLTGGSHRFYMDEFDLKYYESCLKTFYDEWVYSDHHIKRASGVGMNPIPAFKKDREGVLMGKYGNPLRFGVFPTKLEPRFEPKFSEKIVTSFDGEERKRTFPNEFPTSLKERQFFPMRYRIIFMVGDPISILLQALVDGAKTMRVLKSPYLLYHPFDPLTGFHDMNTKIRALGPILTKNGFFRITKGQWVEAKPPGRGGVAHVFMDFSNFDQSHSLVQMEIFLKHFMAMLGASRYATQRALGSLQPLLALWDDVADKDRNPVKYMHKFVGMPSGNAIVSFWNLFQGFYQQTKSLYYGFHLSADFFEFFRMMMGGGNADLSLCSFGDDSWLQISSRFLPRLNPEALCLRPYDVKFENRPRFLGHILTDEGWSIDPITGITNFWVPEESVTNAFKRPNPRAGWDDRTTRLMLTDLGRRLLLLEESYFGKNIRDLLPAGTGPHDPDRALWDPTYKGDFPNTKYIRITRRHQDSVLNFLRS